MSDTFAVVLAELRVARGLSQSRLAHEAGYDHSFVCRLEHGKRDPSRETVLALAEILKATDAERDRLLVSSGFLPLSPVVLGALRLAMEGARL